MVKKMYIYDYILEFLNHCALLLQKEARYIMWQTRIDIIRMYKQENIICKVHSRQKYPNINKGFIANIKW